MNKPQPKREITISRRDNPQELSIDIATEKARDWYLDEVKGFSVGLSFDEDRLKNKPIPFYTVLVVSKCYDIDEVELYLSTPSY